MLPIISLAPLFQWHWIYSQSYPDSMTRFYANPFRHFLLESLALGHSLSRLLTPEILGNRTSLLADTGVLAAGAFGSFRLFQIGRTGRDATLDIPYKSLFQRAAFGVLGIAGLAQVADAVKNRAIGLFTFQSLDSEQQYFVLKHHSVEALGGAEKPCRAVIIDGSSSEWGGRLDDHSDSLVEELYRKC